MHNLIKYVVEPIRKNLGLRLQNHLYHDIYNENELSTDSKSVDIIAHQLELKFEGADPIFISWENVEGWVQYSLCVSETSFSTGAVTFTKKDDNWNEVIGKSLKSLKIYGYRKNAFFATSPSAGHGTEKHYGYEPHLVVFCFENDIELGVANFYSEDDFSPKYPNGDDVWIVFGRYKIEGYVEKLALEELIYEEVTPTSAL